MELSQNVKTHSGSPRFLRKTNKKKPSSEFNGGKDSEAEVGEKSTSFVVYSFNFMQLSNHFFK